MASVSFFCCIFALYYWSSYFSLLLISCILYTCPSFSILIVFIRENIFKASSHHHTTLSGYCPIFLLLFILSLLKEECVLTSFFYSLTFHPLQSELDLQNPTEITLSKATCYFLIVKVDGLFSVFIMYDWYMPFDIVALDYVLLDEILSCLQDTFFLFFSYLSAHF